MPDLTGDGGVPKWSDEAPCADLQETAGYYPGFPDLVDSNIPDSVSTMVVSGKDGTQMVSDNETASLEVGITHCCDCLGLESMDSHLEVQATLKTKTVYTLPATKLGASRLTKTWPKYRYPDPVIGGKGNRLFVWFIVGCTVSVLAMIRAFKVADGNNRQRRLIRKLWTVACPNLKRDARCWFEGSPDLFEIGSRVRDVRFAGAGGTVQAYGGVMAVFWNPFLVKSVLVGTEHCAMAIATISNTDSEPEDAAVAGNASTRC